MPDYVFSGSTPHRMDSRSAGRLARRERRDRRAPRRRRLAGLDRSYQDVAFFASFRCADGLQGRRPAARRERRRTAAMKGIYASLVEGDLASYRVTIDAKGNETSRERLRPAGGGQVRVAPPPPPPPTTPPAGAARDAGAARRRRRGGGGLSPCRCRAASQAPIARPSHGSASGRLEHRRARSSTPTSCARSSTTPAA